MSRLGGPVLLLASVAWFTWPLACSGWGHVVHPGPLSADVPLIAWILAWDAHALATHPLDLFDANAFYPAPHALALSENLLGALPIFAVPWALTGNAIAALNVTTFVGFVLTGWFFYLFAYRWTGSRLAAVVGAATFVFAPSRLPSLRVPHELATYWLPLVAVLVDRALWSGRVRPAAGAAAALVMQTLCSFYLGYMGFLVAGAVVVAHLMVRRRAALWPLARSLPIFLAAPLALAPLGFMYATTLGTDPGRSLEQLTALRQVHHAVGFGGVTLITIESVGWATMIVAALGLSALRGADPARVARVVSLVLTAAVGLALAPGPGGALYDLLLALVPGLDHVRVPLRFGYLTAFAASGLVAFAIAHVAGRRQALLAGTLLAFVAATAMRQEPAIAWPVRVGDQLSASHRWLAEHGEGGPVLEIPMSPPLGSIGDALAMYYSTIGWWPLLNGYSGYHPPSEAFVRSMAERLPDDEALQALVACTGMRWLLVRSCDASRLARWRAVPGLSLRVPASEADARESECLFEVTRAAAAPCRETWPSRLLIRARGRA